MGFLANFTALQKKKKEPQPLLMQGVKTAPNFSALKMDAQSSAANQSTPQGPRVALPPKIQQPVFKAPQPAPQTLKPSLRTMTKQALQFPEQAYGAITEAPARILAEGLQRLPAKQFNLGKTQIQFNPAGAQKIASRPIQGFMDQTQQALEVTAPTPGLAKIAPAMALAAGFMEPLNEFKGVNAAPKLAKGLASKADDIARAAKKSPVLFEQISALLKNADEAKPLAQQLAAWDNFKPLLSKLNMADLAPDDALAVLNRAMQADTGQLIAKLPNTKTSKKLYNAANEQLDTALINSEKVSQITPEQAQAIRGSLRAVDGAKPQQARAGRQISSEAGFIKNPFARKSPPQADTALQSAQQSLPSPKGQPLRDLTPQQSLSLSNDINELKRAPEVNLSKLNISSKGKELIKQTAEEIKPRLSQLIGKPLSNKEVLESAEFTSKTFKKAITREQTKQWEVAITATRQKLAAMAETGVVDRDFIETLQTVRTIASDAGRKLQSFAIEAKPAEMTLKQYMIENMLDLGAKADDLVKAAEGVDFTDLKQAAKFYRQFVKPSARELADTLRYNSMLSSPLTHIVNVASNLINTTLVAPIEKALTGGVDFLSSAVTGKAQKHFAGESGVYLKAYAGAVKQATDKFIDVMRGAAATTNLDLRNVPLYPEGGLKGGIEKTLSFPMKLLEGMDQFFMTLGNAAETASMQYKASKGLKVSQSDIALEASKKAAYRVFRQELFPEGQGTVLNAVDALTQQLFQLRNHKNPIIAWPARLSIPFVQTPMNIFKQGLEYSPAGYFTMIGATDKSAQLTKALMGSAVAAVTGLYAANGRLTWAEPSNEAERNAFRDAGKQPYSIKIGNNWVSYQKLPPTLAFPVSMIALTYQSIQDQKLDESTGELILRSFAKYAEFLSDQSYAKSFGDLLAAFQGEESAITKLASNYPQQFVPFRALTGWLARLTDDIQRKPDPEGTFVEKQVQYLMMNYPGLSQKVPARLNEAGEPIKVQNPKLNAVSPFRISTEHPEKAAEYQDILDIKKLEQEASSRNNVLKDQAEDIAATLASKSPGQQRRELIKLKRDNPALADKVQDVLDMEEQDYTAYEKKLKNASVEARAQMIFKELKGMDRKDQRILLSEYKKKKIVSDAVDDRLKEMRRENR